MIWKQPWPSYLETKQINLSQYLHTIQKHKYIDEQIKLKLREIHPNYTKGDAWEICKDKILK